MNDKIKKSIQYETQGKWGKFTCNLEAETEALERVYKAINRIIDPLIAEENWKE